jgi:hypothetical protein
MPHVPPPSTTIKEKSDYSKQINHHDLMNKLNTREKKVESYKIEEMPDKYHSK